jgi:glycosyltransferase involved in cell wall biosynthesis
MRIGIMLRHFNQHGGGVKNYTNYLLDELLLLNSDHEFVLIYNDRKHIGTYGKYKNVREISVHMPTRILWDQIGIPLVSRKEKLDIIFNPKYSIPLLAKCPTVFVCHGLDWYLMPWGSKWIDVLNHRYLFPRYAAKASKIIAVSNTAREHLIEFLNVEGDRVHTVYLGIHDSYLKEIDKNELNNVKLKYHLPDKFFLYAGQIYPPKNFGRLLQAYAKIGPELGIYLVVAGEHRWLCGEELEMIDRLNISDWVKRPGWIDNQTLRYFYSCAQALVLPSLYESFGLPILEAMINGCPIVTSDRFGTQELAKGAAILVDPENVDCIAEGMEKVVTDEAVRIKLIKDGYKRVEGFSWKKCAAETLDVLEKAYSAPKIKRRYLKAIKGVNRLAIKRPEKFKLLL